MAPAARRGLANAAFVVTGALAVGAARAGWRGATVAARTAMAPALGLKLLDGRRPGDATDTGLFALALTAAAAGDHFMTWEHEEDNLVRGATAFGVMHGLYCALLLRRGARPSVETVAPRAAWWLAGAATIVLTRRERERRVPAVLAAYGAALMATNVLAADPRLAHGAKVAGGVVVPSRDRRTWLNAGAAIFGASDTAIMLRRGLLADGRHEALADAFVMSTYLGAQWLIAEGMLSRS